MQETTPDLGSTCLRKSLDVSGVFNAGEACSAALQDSARSGNNNGNRQFFTIFLY